jgi:hypothetical protein
MSDNLEKQQKKKHKNECFSNSIGSQNFPYSTCNRPNLQGSAFIQKKKKETESSKKKSALQNKYK